MKKVQKTLTGAMAAMMATGVVATPAMAATNNTDVDALYKAAYQATMKVLATKGQSATEQQTAINEARQAIKALPANLETAIGEFSKQVDTIQGPIFANIMKAIKEAQTTKTQAAVNEARKAIPTNLADFYKKPYSSAVDAVQKELQDNAFAAVKKAEAEKKQDLIDAAKALVKELATADSQAIKNFADVLNERLEAIKVYDLDITKVISITKSGISVEFKALDEALKDVTLEVIDNKGNVVAVEKVSSLIEEETTASFNFTNILKDMPTGVWTVNGVTVDLTERANVEKIKGIVDADDLLKELKAIKKFTGIIDANKNAYLAADKDKAVSYEDIQKIIDTVNKDEEKKSAVIYVIEAASGTTTQFKNALATLQLDKVNADWIKEYKNSLESKSYTKASEVQDVIYEVNETQLDNEKKEALKIAETDKREVAINEVISLAKEYFKEDAKDEKDKANFLAELNSQLAIIRVQNSNSLATLKSALVNLEKVVNNKTEFEYAKDVNESMLKAYYEGYKDASGKVVTGFESIKTKSSVTDIKNQLDKIQSEVIKEKLTAVDKALATPAKDGKYSTEEKAAITNALKAVVTATSNKSGDDKFVMDKVVEANYEQYLLAKTATITNIKVLNTLIADGNNKPLTSAISDINSADDASKLLAALKNATLGLKNVVDANKDAYINENITVNEVKEGFQALSKKDDIQNLVNAVNAAQVVLTSNNIDEVSNAVLSFAVSAKGNEAVKNLNSLVRKDVAEEVKVLLKDVKSLTTTELTTKLATAISNQSNKIKAVNHIGVNGEALEMTNSSMVSALKGVSSEFNNLSEVNKIIVAEKFIAKFPTHKDASGNVVRTNFVNYTEIRTLLAECMK